MPGLARLSLLPLLLATGCSTLPPPVAHVPCAQTLPPHLSRSPDGAFASTHITVLTYNIEGLGWPARTGRRPSLERIGRRLSAMREAGSGPDIVLFQEMFSDAAKRAVAAAGYPAITSGPRRTTGARGSTRRFLPGRSSLKRGEIGIHLYGSGLAIASRWPIVNYSRRAYGRRSCAGFDCLSNKGIAMARIAIPGVPTPIDVYDTHMNSRGASGAPAARNLAAHDRQAQEASRFIDETHDDGLPLVFGGDFNMRRSEPRWENFSRYQSLGLVHRICASPDSGCEVKMSWDGDEPWMDTQDLQFLWSGDAVKIRPVRVEALFDGSPDSPVLSDHDGFMVTYELRWKAALTRSPACPVPAASPPTG
ncbi:endonuclease/exonuclease/phosphatase family protein [Sphingomonas sp. IC081]|uniref:endonuclease/exonuclease/phosphatase family protein n=1 Tax=Sphingomonas sp. IC081 TaxID=304378 RepID=UPI00115AA84D|nr:endonuclease/exonuclease/phosphatase family protein [Sphingomonas sp. IC081]QDK32033.1 metal-dependent hydrolase [Sphingomonas sp. IC081]